MLGDPGQIMSSSSGKTYCFFDQLEAFQNSSPSQPLPPLPTSTAVSAMVVTAPTGNPPRPVPVALPQFTVSSGQNTSGHINPRSSFPAPPRPTFAPVPLAAVSNVFPGNALSCSTSSLTSSDEDIQRRHRKKRKWKEFFERVMKDVILKQEEMQRRRGNKRET